MTWVYALSAVGIVSLVSFAGLVTLAMRQEALKRIVFILVGLATGALFGDALIHLIPEALESGMGEMTVGIAVMSGIILFFALEKFLFWHHCHGEHEESCDTLTEHDHAPKHLGALILTADFVHNAVDGIIIGASFLVNIEVGIATTVAVVLHEIPQEIADFGLLIHAGWSRGKALLWNFFSALSAFLGVAVVLFFGVGVENLVPIAAAFTAGAFIYIAGSDLVPELHKTEGFGRTVIQMLAVALGFALMLLLVLAE
ncbi:MAG: ZIP family metal transporter [bacterium]|nr:ZIP family metal transporter [bacterium]